MHNEAAVTVVGGKVSKVSSHISGVAALCVKVKKSYLKSTNFSKGEEENTAILI